MFIAILKTTLNTAGKDMNEYNSEKIYENIIRKIYIGLTPVGYKEKDSILTGDGKTFSEKSRHRYFQQRKSNGIPPSARHSQNKRNILKTN